MLPTVQAQRHLLGQQFVGIPALLVVLCNGERIPPPGRTLFLPPAIDTLIGNIDANSQTIEHEENQQRFEALVTPDDVKGIFQCCAEAFQQRAQTAFQQWSAEQCQPSHRENAADIENAILPGQLIVHGQSSFSASSPARQ